MYVGFGFVVCGVVVIWLICINTFCFDWGFKRWTRVDDLFFWRGSRILMLLFLFIVIKDGTFMCFFIYLFIV